MVLQELHVQNILKNYISQSWRQTVWPHKLHGPNNCVKKYRF